MLFELIVMSWHILKKDRRKEKGGGKGQGKECKRDLAQKEKEEGG